MFFKKSIDVHSFNALIVQVIGVFLASQGRSPTEPEFISGIDFRLKAVNGKLSEKQERQAKDIAFRVRETGLGDELMPYCKKFLKEYPADMTSFDAILNRLQSRGLLSHGDFNIDELMNGKS